MYPEVITIHWDAFNNFWYFFVNLSMKFIPHFVRYRYNQPCLWRFFLPLYTNIPNTKINIRRKIKLYIRKLILNNNFLHLNTYFFLIVLKFVFLHLGHFTFFDITLTAWVLIFLLQFLQIKIFWKSLFWATGIFVAILHCPHYTFFTFNIPVFYVLLWC